MVENLRNGNFPGDLVDSQGHDLCRFFRSPKWTSPIGLCLDRFGHKVCDTACLEGNVLPLCRNLLEQNTLN